MIFDVRRIMQGHRDLQVWQKAMLFVTDIYRATSIFPRSEVYGLTNQVRRAAVSVPSNIAKGCGRSSKKEFAQFLSHVLGSLLEVETQLEIAQNLGYLSDQSARDLLLKTNEIGRMLNGLRSWCEAA
jgi:four helix bundle protein